MDALEKRAAEEDWGHFLKDENLWCFARNPLNHELIESNTIIVPPEGQVLATICVRTESGYMKSLVPIKTSFEPGETAKCLPVNIYEWTPTNSYLMFERLIAAGRLKVYNN